MLVSLLYASVLSRLCYLSLIFWLTVWFGFFQVALFARLRTFVAIAKPVSACPPLPYARIVLARPASIAAPLPSAVAVFLLGSNDTSAPLTAPRAALLSVSGGFYTAPVPVARVRGSGPMADSLWLQTTLLQCPRVRTLQTVSGEKGRSVPAVALDGIWRCVSCAASLWCFCFLVFLPFDCTFAS